MPGTIVLPAFVADSTLTTKGELSLFIVDSTLTTKGELAPFVADASLDSTVYLDLASFVVDASLNVLTGVNLAPPLLNSSTRPRWLALPQIEPVPDGIYVTLPKLVADITEPYGNIDGAILPVITSSIAAPFTNGIIDAFIGGVILTDGFDEDDNPIVIETPGTITALLGDGSVSGTLVVTLPSISAFLPSEEFGEIDSVLPRSAANLEAISSTTGEIAGSLAVISVDMEGGEYGLQATLPLLTSDLAPSDTATANISAQLPWMSSDISGTNTGSGGINITLPYVQASLDATAGQVASLQSELRTASSEINALLGASASLDAALTVLEAEFASAQQVSATISVTLPDFEFIATGYMSLAQVATYVVDTMNNALTTYEAFPFNSFAEINGKYYGAGPAGLFELVGDKDDGVTQITSVVSTGHLHFGSEMQKRMSDFFVAMRASGDITLTVTTDEVNSYEYTLSPLDIETLKQRRSLIGKGAKGKYWQFSLTNVDGCDFDFDSFNAAAVVLGRRL